MTWELVLYGWVLAILLGAAYSDWRYAHPKFKGRPPATVDPELPEDVQAWARAQLEKAGISVALPPAPKAASPAQKKRSTPFTTFDRMITEHAYDVALAIQDHLPTCRCIRCDPRGERRKIFIAPPSKRPLPLAHHHDGLDYRTPDGMCMMCEDVYDDR